jgi:acetyl-CoA C-acetyltransferase
VKDERRPVLVGVGQVRGNRERTVEGVREPLSLLLDAVRAAEADGGVPLREVDAVDVVKVASWAYDGLAGKVAARSGITPVHTFDTTVGGHWPALLLERAAARIAAGESRVTAAAWSTCVGRARTSAESGADPAALGWSAAIRENSAYSRVPGDGVARWHPPLPRRASR